MVTVAAVDVGVLNITDFTTPNPWNHFFSRRRLASRSHDLYGRIIEQVAGSIATLRFGGDADISRMRRGSRDQAKVNIISLFSGPVMVDATGVAKIKLPIPDFNGTLRIMVTAFSKDSFASTDREVTIAAPLVAEISMPRFLAIGDQSNLTLDLHNLSGKEQELNLRLLAESPLDMAPSLQQITLADQARSTIRLPITTGNKTGVGRINLDIIGDDLEIKRHWQLAVHSPYPARRSVQTAILDVGDKMDAMLTLDEKLWHGLQPETAELLLQISDTPPFNIRELVKGLLSYPHGCLEQTTSRAFPLLYVDSDRARAMNIPPLTREERGKRIEKAINKLNSMWRASGGYGLWGADSPVEPWLTAYVGDFLLTVREAGFGVAEFLLDKTILHLQRQLKGHQATLQNVLDGDAGISSRAYAGYVLSRISRASLGDLRALARKLNKQTPPLTLVHLGVAMALQGDRAGGLALIKKGVEMPPSAKQNWENYGGPVRDLGMMAAILIRHKLGKEHIQGLLSRLQKAVAPRSWTSTQEKLALFLALFSPDAGKHDQLPWYVVLLQEDNKEQLSAKGSLQKLLLGSEQWSKLALKTKSATRLFMRATVTGYPIDAPTPVEKPLAIERTLYNLDGSLLESRKFEVGEMLVVHIRVNSPEMLKYGLVESRLPAGLELENPAIMAGEGLQDLELAGIKPTTSMRSHSIRHQEFRADRYVAAVKLSGKSDLFYLLRVVTPGIYTWPPIIAEDMYRPHLRGVGTTDIVTVVARP